MSISKPIPESIDREFDYIYNQIAYLFEQCRFYNEMFGNKSTVMLLNRSLAKSASGLIQQAVKTEIAIGIGRLLDPADENMKNASRATTGTQESNKGQHSTSPHEPITAKKKKEPRENISFQRLIAHLSKHYKIGEDVIAGLETRLDALRTAFEPLKKWRDKHHAHRDLLVTTGQQTLGNFDAADLDRMIADLTGLGLKLYCFSKGTSPDPDVYRFAIPGESPAAQLLKCISTSFALETTQPDPPPGRPGKKK